MSRSQVIIRSRQVSEPDAVASPTRGTEDNTVGFKSHSDPGSQTAVQDSCPASWH